MTELDRFCVFCARFLTTEEGDPLVIEEFQRRILADYFDGARETLVLIGKKNGKTSLFAALALWHVITVPFADVAVLAAARDQATKLLNQLTGYIKRHPSLYGRLRITQRVVHCDHTSGKVAVLASDSDTLDGWGGSLALVDELSRHRSEENFGLLRDGLGPRDGRLVAFSTAGDDEESALGRLRAAAHAMPGFARSGTYKHVRAGGFAWHEWALDPGDDPDDLELVLSANPASWIDLAELHARRDSPSMQSWQWARFTCGLWVSGEDSAISGREWAACARPGVEIPAGSTDVVVGVDLGWKWDSTAFVPVWRRGEPRDTPIVVGDPTIMAAPRDGTSLDAEDVFAVCEGYARRWPGCMFVLDPEAGGQQLAQRLEREIPGSDVVEYSQKTGPMCAASQRLAEMVAAGELCHPGDEELDRHVLSASAKFVGEQWRLVKPRGKRLLIDGAVALALALEVASRPPAAVPTPGFSVLA